MTVPDLHPLHNPRRHEMGIIGAVVLSADELQQPAIRALKPHQFRYLGGLWHIIRDLADQGIDPSISELAQHMNDRYWPSSVSLSDLIDLPAFAMRPEDLAGAARGIVSAYRREHGVTVAADLGRALSSSETDPLNAMSAAHAALTDLIGVNVTDSTVSIADDLHDAMQHILNPQKHRGITTGIPVWDAALGGWQNASLNLLAARPSMGKSALMGQCAQAAAFNQAHALLFSLEDNEKIVRMRALSRLSGIELSYDPDAPRPGNAQVRLSNAAAKLETIRGLWMIDPEDHLDSIISTCWQRHKEGRLDIVFIDQLSHILAAPATQRASNRNELYGYVTKTLKKDVARRLNVPVVLAHQLSRESAKKGAEPELTDLRDSGEIEQDADTVTFIHRWEYYDPKEKPGLAGLLGRKNRNGATYSLTVQASMKNFKFWQGDYS